MNMARRESREKGERKTEDRRRGDDGLDRCVSAVHVMQLLSIF